MKIYTIKVELEFIRPIIFNEGFVSIKEETPTEKKVPLNNGNDLVSISGDRLMAFLIDNKPERPPGCIKSFLKPKEYKSVLPKAKAYIGFQPIIPILCNGKEIHFKSFDKTKEIKVRKDRVFGGPVPMIVERPVIENASMKFNISLVENQEISLEKLKSWFERGGIEVALGCSRPVYGQFIVKVFEIEKTTTT